MFSHCSHVPGGLVCGIASGKSTVVSILRELGWAVIDADVIARQVVQPGTSAHSQIVFHFGEEVLLKNGELDREKMGIIIFSSPEKRAVLNSITHPPIRRAMLRQTLCFFFVERLISLVEQHPELWDTRCEGYHDRLAIERAWFAIAEHLYPRRGWSTYSPAKQAKFVALVKRRWRSARDQFRQEFNPLHVRTDDNLEDSDESPTTARSVLCTSASESEAPADPTPSTQPDEQVSDAAEISTDAGPESTQTTAPTTSQTAAPAPQAASTANLPQYLTHTLRDRRTRRHEQPRMLPELIDARVLSILNSMTPENSVDRFCRSLSPCLGKVPDGRQERVRAAILTLIAASQGEPEPNQVLGPIEQW
ncbi:uncharacterized protein LOC143765983 [Ranitomeya variabilis]|uniref:uncharacterized protein LOC143765983 n=1 Tax=Ranitomeya variabilis TaxID=490064 RepID=UPI00405607A8